MRKIVDKRNYGIDLLRMVSMFLVIILHILGAGGILNATDGLRMHHALAWFLEICAFCAVNCYALISGYASVGSKYKFSNIINLWLQVFFYNFIFYIIFAILGWESISLRNVLGVFFPVLTESYWYFTAYFCLFLFIPFLNLALEKIPKKTLKTFIVLGILFLSIFPTIIRRDIFITNGGYSAFWLMFLYLIGGYLKKYGFLSNLSGWKLFVGYICCVVFTFISKFFIADLNILFFNEVRYDWMFIGYTSPSILFSAIFLLLLFSKLSVERFKKIISFFAPLSFAVYLIHSNKLFGLKFWNNKFIFLTRFNPFIMIFIVVAIACFIYVICSFIDVIRKKIFDMLKVKERISLIDTKYLKKYY